MTTGETLATELQRVNEQMGQLNNSEGDISEAKKNALKSLETDIYGEIHAKTLPPDLSDEFVRRKTGIAPHLWNDAEIYSAQLRGKIGASEIIKNHIELVERFYSIMKKNANKAQQQSEAKKRKTAPNRNQKMKKAKTVNRYRRRR